VERLLIDSERCEFIAVAIPEAMPVLETSRLLPRLSGLSVTCRCVMVNMVMPQVECDFCAAVRGDQQRHMEKLHTVFPALTQIPLFPHEVKGIAGLTEIGRAIYGDGDG
jgi:arsenite-transporting ATPase